MADSKDQSLIHREMARRAQDIHRVKNPRNEPYRLVWDGFIDIIPANGTADLETYKTDKYLKEMTVLLIREKIQSELDAENQRRRDRGEKEMEKWTGEAQHVLESKVATNLNNPDNQLKIYQELYVGLVKEYGIEKVERKEYVTPPSTHEQIMDKLLGSKIMAKNIEPLLSEPPIIQPITPEIPLNQINRFELIRMAKDKGIPTQKTDKKEELISKISQV